MYSNNLVLGIVLVIAGGLILADLETFAGVCAIVAGGIVLWDARKHRA